MVQQEIFTSSKTTSIRVVGEDEAKISVPLVKSIFGVDSTGSKILWLEKLFCDQKGAYQITAIQIMLGESYCYSPSCPWGVPLPFGLRHQILRRKSPPVHYRRQTPYWHHHTHRCDLLFSSGPCTLLYCDLEADLGHRSEGEMLKLEMHQGWGCNQRES